DSVSRGQGNGPRPAAPGSSPGHDPRGIGMSFVTPAHVHALASAEFSDLPVLATDIEGEIELVPRSTAQARGAEILTGAAALDEYTGGEGLDDTLAEQFAAEINEAYDLFDDTADT